MHEDLKQHGLLSFTSSSETEIVQLQRTFIQFDSPRLPFILSFNFLILQSLTTPFGIEVLIDLKCLGARFFKKIFFFLKLIF